MNKQYQNIKLVNNFLVDFNKLALKDTTLQKYVFILNDRVVWNFSNQESLIRLTKAIMKYIFSIQWKCPSANLCPRIPSRINYLLWLSVHIPEIKNVLDVGTGATLIYPLLGWSVFKWSFIAIQINQESYQHSKELIEANSLKQFIDLRLSRPNPELQSILHPIIQQTEEISAVLCNPPFFQQEQTALSVMSSQEHHTQCGEYGFFFILYKDSYRYRSIKHFSCLIGRASDFDLIKKFMIEEDRFGFLAILKFGQIIQGKNKRFIVLWSTKEFILS